MTPDEIEDFREDVAENSVVSLLLGDGSQLVGVVRKIRADSVSIAPAGARGVVRVTPFEEIRRYALGRYDFIREAPISRTGVASTIGAGLGATIGAGVGAGLGLFGAVLGFVLGGVRKGAPNGADDADGAMPQGNAAPRNPLSPEEAERKLRECRATFSRILEETPVPRTVVPRFRCLQAPDSELGRRLLHALDSMKDQYESAVRMQELDRLSDILRMVRRNIAIFPKSPELHALEGAFHGMLDNVNDAVISMKIAASLSDSAYDWRNLAIVSREFSDMSFFAMTKSIRAKYPADFDVSWLVFYVRTAANCKFFWNAGHDLARISRKARTDGELRLIAQALIFLLECQNRIQDAWSCLFLLEPGCNVKAELSQCCSRLYGEDAPEDERERLADIARNMEEEVRKAAAEKAAAGDGPDASGGDAFPEEKGTARWTAREFAERAGQEVANGGRDGAIRLYERGIAEHPSCAELRLGLIRQCAAMSRWDAAARACQELAGMEVPADTRKNALLQRAMLLARLNRPREAGRQMAELVASHPEEDYFRRLLGHLRFGVALADSPARPPEHLLDWGERPERIPSILNGDLDAAEFYDEQVLARDGHPTPEDAHRLALLALQQEKTSAGRLASLQAAKACSLLPAGCLDPDEHRKCLTLLAMQKGGSLLSRMRGLASSPALLAANAGRLSSLGEAALGCFQEALSMSPPDFMERHAEELVENIFQCFCMMMLASDPGRYDVELLGADAHGKMRRAVEHIGSAFFDRFFDCLFSVGVASGVRRNERFRELCGSVCAQVGPDSMRILLDKYIDDADNHGMQNFDAIFDAYENDYKVLQEWFFDAGCIVSNGTFEYFRMLKEKLDTFPMQSRFLMGSELEMMRNIMSIVDMMSGYRKASSQERAAMLVRARQGDVSRTGGQQLAGGLLALKNGIIENPTYWKQVGFYPIVEQCVFVIDQMEERRARMNRPKLVFSLEPQVFSRTDHGTLTTNIHVKNIGPVESVSTKIFVSVCRNRSGNSIFDATFAVEKVDAMTGEEYIKLEIPSENIDVTCDGDAVVVVNCVDSEKHEIFTVDIERDVCFLRKDIPWKPLGGDVDESIFKGRDDFLDRLVGNLGTSQGRMKAYMLYGVARSGKTTILKFLLERLNGCQVEHDILHRTFACFRWNFMELSARSRKSKVWQGMLHDAVKQEMMEWKNAEDMLRRVGNSMLSEDMACSDNFRLFTKRLRENGIYPVFLIDEFSYFKNLYDRTFLDASFLAMMRELAFADLATFVFAGTYDILELVGEKKYGITAQFANLQQLKVTSIAREPAGEIVDFFKSHLRFTEDAKQHVLHLSDCRPYWIQTICYYCACLAAENKRSVIGFSDVENVVFHLVEGGKESTLIPRLNEMNFANNSLFEGEKFYPFFRIIATLLARHGKDRTGFLSYENIKAIWDEHSLPSDALESTLNDLMNREVVEKMKDEDEEGYRMKVELFRRWWACDHMDVSREVDSLK